MADSKEQKVQDWSPVSPAPDEEMSPVTPPTVYHEDDMKMVWNAGLQAGLSLAVAAAAPNSAAVNFAATSSAAANSAESAATVPTPSAAAATTTGSTEFSSSSASSNPNLKGKLVPTTEAEWKLRKLRDKKNAKEKVRQDKKKKDKLLQGQKEKPAGPGPAA